MNARYALVFTLSFCALTTSACREATARATADAQARLARGKYLVAITGCGDCHTPMKMGPRGPQPDLSRAFSGHPADLRITQAPPPPAAPWLSMGTGTNTAFAGPWGVSFAANLTPDPTGLGAWNESILVETMRSGRHWGTSRAVLPPMPWRALSHATDDDLRSMFTYLRSLPAVDNTVPEPLPPARR